MRLDHLLSKELLSVTRLLLVPIVVRGLLIVWRLFCGIVDEGHPVVWVFLASTAAFLGDWGVVWGTWGASGWLVVCVAHCWVLRDHASDTSVPRASSLRGSFLDGVGLPPLSHHLAFVVGGGGLVGVLFENWTVDASILLIVLGSLR